MEEIVEILESTREFLVKAREKQDAGQILHAEALEPLEKSLMKTCWLIQNLVSDEIFVQNFPLDQAVRIREMPWGLQLIGYPALPRRSNNCWAINYQIYLWERYFALTNPSRSVRGQYLAAITYRTEKESYCNTVEAHAYLNGTTQILLTEDSPAYMDLSVRTEKPTEQSYFEICLVRKTSDLYEKGIAGGRINVPAEYDLSGAAEELIQYCFTAKDSLYFTQKDLMELYRLLSRSLGELRMKCPESAEKLRKKKMVLKSSYERENKENPFIIEKTEDGIFLIQTNAGLRTREVCGSHFFADELSRFLKKKKWKRTESYRAEILRKPGTKNRCDHDNTAYSDVLDVLMKHVKIPPEEPLVICSCQNLSCNTCIRLIPLKKYLRSKEKCNAE